MTTIGKQLQEQLKAAEGQQGRSIEATVDGVTVAVDTEQCDRYAVGVERVRVTSAEPVDVERTAKRIADQVTAIEPLRVLEVDSREGQAILRSAEPESEGDSVHYWEATVKPGETTVQRYCKDHSAPDREAQVEPMFHRDVRRLADELADAVKGKAE